MKKLRTVYDGVASNPGSCTWLPCVPDCVRFQRLSAPDERGEVDQHCDCDVALKLARSVNAASQGLDCPNSEASGKKSVTLLLFGLFSVSLSAASCDAECAMEFDGAKYCIAFAESMRNIREH